MGWVLERATHTDYAELLSQELWSKLGAERDAYVLLDGFQAAYADPGLNMTLRDLGRFSQMVLQRGLYNGRQIINRAGPVGRRHPPRRRSCGLEEQPGVIPLFPHTLRLRERLLSKLLVLRRSTAREHITAIGLAGQLIVIDPASQTIVVKFSSHATPAQAQYDIEYAGAMAIVDALSH